MFILHLQPLFICISDDVCHDDNIAPSISAIHDPASSAPRNCCHVTSRSRPQLGSPAGAASVQLRPALYTSAWLGGVSCRIWTLLDIITAQHRFQDPVSICVSRTKLLLRYVKIFYISAQLHYCVLLYSVVNRSLKICSLLT